MTGYKKEQLREEEFYKGKIKIYQLLQLVVEFQNNVHRCKTVKTLNMFQVAAYAVDRPVS